MSPARRRTRRFDELDEVPDDLRPEDLVLRTFPSTDTAFAAFAREALEGATRPSTRILQEQLRQRYPAAVVRAQDDLARRGGGGIVWYAFRYGGVAQAPVGPRSTDWTDPDIAWAIIDDERRFVDLNDALAAIVEEPRDAIIGRAIEEFTNPDDPTIREDLAALWSHFVEARVAESTIRYNRADGRYRQLAYRIVADDPEPGLHRIRVLELDSTWQ
ncbi:MAG TPA: PAS domain-containing protein [Clostridia bacterium]|nr:PAS domain-containing protein [Clostridia bacterium]